LELKFVDLKTQSAVEPFSFEAAARQMDIPM
jgi:hypothetical protein